MPCFMGYSEDSEYSDSLMMAFRLFNNDAHSFAKIRNSPFRTKKNTKSLEDTVKTLRFATGSVGQTGAFCGFPM